jgi:hypothetical protein
MDSLTHLLFDLLFPVIYNEWNNRPTTVSSRFQHWLDNDATNGRTQRLGITWMCVHTRQLFAFAASPATAGKRWRAGSIATFFPPPIHIHIFIFEYILVKNRTLHVFTLMHKGDWRKWLTFGLASRFYPHESGLIKCNWTNQLFVHEIVAC